MSEGFTGEIRMTAFNFAPKGYALCNGQLMQISQYQALFTLLSNAYGGDGVSSFALPNFQGRTPVHVGNGFALAQNGGEAAHTLSTGEIPSHIHGAYASSGAATAGSPANNLLANIIGENLYGGASSLVSTDAGTIQTAGSSQPHPNMQPYCTISFCIALVGVYPTRA